MAAADHIGDQPGPAGLVRGADRGAVVAVEVLAEDQVVLPGRIVLQQLRPAEAGPAAIRPAGERRRRGTCWRTWGLAMLLKRQSGCAKRRDFGGRRGRELLV